MRIIISILAIGFAIIFLLIFVAYIIRDIKNAKCYFTATRVNGTICGNRGAERVAFYGRNQYRKYTRYVVDFQLAGDMYTKEVLLKNKKLQNGDIVKVRCAGMEKGYCLVDNISVARLCEIAVAVILAVPLCAFIISRL